MQTIQVQVEKTVADVVTAIGAFSLQQMMFLHIGVDDSSIETNSDALRMVHQVQSQM